MKDAFAGIVASYIELTGTSKVVLLFLVSIIAIILLNENNTDEYERRRINPTVFLLSPWSGISYAIVRALSGQKKLAYLAGMAFSAAMIILSGNIVFTRVCYTDSVFFGTRPVVKALAVVSIVIYIGIYYMISRQLFEKNSERAVFMFFVLLLHAFGNYSEKAMEFSLFMGPVKIPSIFIHDLLPVILLWYLVFEENIKKVLGLDETEADDEVLSVDDNGDEIPEEWDMKKHKILNMRNMSVAFAVFFVIFIAAIFVLNKKINSLYDATVLLENAANTKMTVDELKGADGTVDMTLMISPDGTVTVLGGGALTSGTEAYEMISKYTEKVDKWYLYGDDENSRGAYDFCVDQGMEVVETYVVTGIEKVEE